MILGMAGSSGPVDMSLGPLETLEPCLVAPCVLWHLVSCGPLTLAANGRHLCPERINMYLVYP